MQRISFSEENYIKWIYRLSNGGKDTVNTSALAEHMKTRPASVTDMVQKLAEKRVVNYEKYRGVHITDGERHGAGDNPQAQVMGGFPGR